MLSALPDVNASTKCITWPKKSHCTLFQLFWPDKCSCAIHDAIGITWCWCQWHHMTKISCYILFWSPWPIKWNGSIGDIIDIMWHWHQQQWHHMTKKIMLHIVSIILTYWMQWCYRQYYQHHMMLILVQILTVSNDWRVMLHLNFDHLELANAMVLLMMPSVLCHATSGIIWWVFQVSPCFNHLDLTKKTVLVTMPQVLYDAGTGANNICDQKSHVTPCFSCLHLMKKMVQLQHNTGKILFDLILIIVT